MDYSALMNTLLTDENLREISRETKTTPDEVKRVVNAAVPLFEENGAQAAETKLTRAAANGTNRSILGTLLGAGASAAVSQNSGVSQKKTSSILSLIAPLLLSSMLGTSQNASSNSGLSSLLGAGMASQQAQPQVQQPQTINLFGGQTQQPAQNNTSAGASLLSSLLGGMGGLQQAQPVQQVQQPQTINLFGGQPQVQQTQQAAQGGGLMDLLMGLISTDTSGN